MSLLASAADYVFTQKPPAEYLSRYRQLGRYINEGSKPGAMAASVYVTHRVLPLDHTHFGRLPEQTLLAAELFVELGERFFAQCAHHIHGCVPFTPDSNIVCLALNPNYIDRYFEFLARRIAVLLPDN